MISQMLGAGKVGIFSPGFPEFIYFGFFFSKATEKKSSGRDCSHRNRQAGARSWIFVFV
jgi:hypothetical protein